MAICGTRAAKVREGCVELGSRERGCANDGDLCGRGKETRGVRSSGARGDCVCRVHALFNHSPGRRPRAHLVAHGNAAVVRAPHHVLHADGHHALRQAEPPHLVPWLPQSLSQPLVPVTHSLCPVRRWYAHGMDLLGIPLWLCPMHGLFAHWALDAYWLTTLTEVRKATLP